MADAQITETLQNQASYEDRAGMTEAQRIAQEAK